MDRIEYRKILLECERLSISKNKDYSDKPIEEFGSYGLLVRCWDKICRLKTLLEKDDIAVRDEKIEDTAKDLINYMVYLIMVERKRL